MHIVPFFALGAMTIAVAAAAAAAPLPAEPAVTSLLLRQLGVCLLYGGSSVMLSMTNKALLSWYDCDFVFTMLLAQLLLSLFVCVVSRDYMRGNPLAVPAFATGVLVEAAPLGTVYVLNVALGLVSLKMVPVPMFFALRRLVAPLLLAYEALVLRKFAPAGVNGSVAVIVVGTLLAGWDTFSDDALGYTLTMICNGFTAANSILQRQLADKRRLSVFGVLYVNALVAAPLAAMLALFTGEPERILSFPYLASPSFWAGFWATALMGILLTYSSILSTTYLSPLATCITGNAKDVATTAIGWIAFAGFKPTRNAVAGIGLSFLGAFAYSYTNVVIQMRAAAERAAAKLHSGGDGDGPIGGKGKGSGGTPASASTSDAEVGMASAVIGTVTAVDIEDDAGRHELSDAPQAGRVRFAATAAAAAAASPA